jgi:hypothetical protein
MALMTNNYYASISPSWDDRGTYQGWSPSIKWCQENLNDRRWRYDGEGIFEFKQEQDYTMFLLRWDQ